MIADDLYMHTQSAEDTNGISEMLLVISDRNLLYLELLELKKIMLITILWFTYGSTQPFSTGLKAVAWPNINNAD